jgi:RNA polymerase sigma factor (sigma-70 family)
MDYDKAIAENTKLVYKVIHSLEYIPNKVDWEDIEQVGKIALWEALKTYDEDKYTLSTWCYAIIKSTILDYLRSTQALKRQDIIIEDNVMYAEEEAMGNLMISEIEQIIGKDNTQMLVDQILNELTLQQLSEKYNLSVKQIRTRISKSKDILKTKLN